MPSKTHRAAAVRLRTTGTSKASQIDEFKALLDWPGLYLMAQACDELPEPDKNRPGRQSDMPTSLLLAVSCAARICGSRAGALELVGSRDVWHKMLRPVWEARPENEHLVFPARAPRVAQLLNFERRLIDPQYKTRKNKLDAIEDPTEKAAAKADLRTLKLARQAALQERFQAVAMAQAKQMGLFDTDVPIDWTQPGLEHTVIGDGTVVKPFSMVREHEDPVTGEVFYTGTRAVKNPRLSPRGTDLEPDNKKALRGLNMVSLLSPTRWGWVILGTSYAERAEQWPALDLIESAARRSKGGVHNVLWDRVLSGWLLDSLLANQRLRVFNKSVAASTEKTKLPEHPTVSQAVRHTAAEQHARLLDHSHHQMALAEVEYAHLEATKSWDVHQPTRDERHEEARVLNHLRDRDLADLYETGKPLPLGVSLYAATSASTVTGSRIVTGRGKVDLVRSEPTRYGRYTHHVDSGAADGAGAVEGDGGCTHDLWVDDGALHTVEMDPILGCLVKTATATCLSSTPHKNGRRWATTETWSIACPRGDFEITTTWEPHGTRYTPDDLRKKPALSPLNDLRPISRSQAQDFANIANHRNQAESFNQWFKTRLPQPGRAASLTIEAQVLDYLGAACLRNALTWANWHQDED